MRAVIIVAAGMMLAAPAMAQISNPPASVKVDTSNLPTKADLQAVADAAAAAKANADAAKAQAAALSTTATTAQTTAQTASQTATSAKTTADAAAAALATAQADAATAKAAADAAKATADTAASRATAISSSLPSVCDQPPAPDAMIGTAGTGVPCTPRKDAARQTLIPPASAITSADGSFSGSWQATLPAAPTRGVATIYSGVNPYHCQLATMTVAGFTGKCWQIVTTTLPGLPASLLNLVVSPIANPATGLTVNVFARY